MKIDSTFESKWLKAADVDEMADDETNTAVVAIDRIEVEEIGQDNQKKPVVYFKGIDVGLVLNKTNATTIKDLYGNETDDWIGKRIGLFTTEVDYQGKQMLGIRVRLKAPKAKKGKTEDAELFPAEIPF